MVIPLHDDNPTRRTAVVTLALIAINVFVYFFVQPSSPFAQNNVVEAQRRAAQEQKFLYEHAAIPCEIKQQHPLTVAELETGQCGNVAGTPEVFPNKSVWLSILESLFFHGSILHIGGNMLFLWIFGNNVEDRLGPLGYTLFYLVGGVLATLVFVFVQPNAVTPLIGASGAIATVMGAYLVWFPRARILSIVPIFIFFFVRLPAAVVLGLWFVMQFFTSPNSGVAWTAHVGGFVIGALVAFVLRPPKTPSPLPDWA